MVLNIRQKIIDDDETTYYSSTEQNLNSNLRCSLEGLTKKNSFIFQNEKTLCPFGKTDRTTLMEINLGRITTDYENEISHYKKKKSSSILMLLERNSLENDNKI